MCLSREGAHRHSGSGVKREFFLFVVLYVQRGHMWLIGDGRGVKDSSEYIYIVLFFVNVSVIRFLFIWY